MKTNEEVLEELKKAIAFVRGNTGVDADKVLYCCVKEALQLKEDQMKEAERKRAATIVEEMMEDEEHWQPIASRILSGSPQKPRN